MHKWFYVVLVLMMFVTACHKENVPEKAKIGGKAPDFVLKNLVGQEVRLGDLRGKVLLVNFWATWCPPCVEEIPSMQKLNNLMKGKPFQMLAISIDEDGKEAITGFLRRNGGELPVLLDSEQKISKLYGTTGVPETFVVDKNGIIIDKVVGAMDWSNPQVVQSLIEIMNRI